MAGPWYVVTVKYTLTGPVRYWNLESAYQGFRTFAQSQNILVDDTRKILQPPTSAKGAFMVLAIYRGQDVGESLESIKAILDNTPGLEVAQVVDFANHHPSSADLADAAKREGRNTIPQAIADTLDSATWRVILVLGLGLALYFVVTRSPSRK